MVSAAYRDIAVRTKQNNTDVMESLGPNDLNEGHYFELMDRASVFASIFEDHVAAHPVVEADECLGELVERARELHGEIYQRAGTLWGAQCEDPPTSSSA